MINITVFHLKGEVPVSATTREYCWSMISFYRTFDSPVLDNHFNYKVSTKER